MSRKSNTRKSLAAKNNVDQVMASEDDDEEDDQKIDLKTIDFLNTSVLNFQKIQTADERRVIRIKYRSMIEETEKISEDLDAIKPNELKAHVERASVLFSKVKLPREGAYDTYLLKQCSDLGKKKASVLQTGLQQFSEDDFANQIILFLKNENDGEILTSQNDDEDEDDAPTSSRRTSNAGQILTRKDWEKFGKEFSPFFKIAPGISFLSTCLDRDPYKVKPKAERKIREAFKKDVVGEIVKPKRISVKLDETEEEKTTKFVENVHNCLKFVYQQMGTPIGYFDFIVNPKSFEKTIENIFHLSFLIKDGFAKLSFDEQNLPTIEPTEKISGPKNGTSQQCVISMDYDEWKEIVEKFEIEDTLIE